MRRMISTLGIATLSLTLSSVTHAGTSAQIEKRYSQGYMDCLYNGDNTTDLCASDEYKIQDGRLNQAYIMVMNRQNKAGKAKLRAFQRALIVNRDANCKKNSSVATVESECKINETIAQTIWLEKYR